MEFSISYIISTRNRLPFLKITLEKLLSERRDDEEIVVVDGDSSDGSREYLQQLFNAGKIQQFVSEPDRNQAHGWNKAMLLAKGTVIKKIIDDDVFCYNSIRRCRDHMLANPEVDVVISNDMSCIITNPKNISKHSRLEQFMKWRNREVPSFTFGDVHMLLRRQSIAFLGLYYTEFIMIDWEYSLRISHLQSRITYFTGYNALSVSHPGNVTSNANQLKNKKQGNRGSVFYEYAGDGADMSLWSSLKINAGRILFKRPAIQAANVDKSALADIYKELYTRLAKENQVHSFEFIVSQL